MQYQVQDWPGFHTYYILQVPVNQIYQYTPQPHSEPGGKKKKTQKSENTKIAYGVMIST
jgi:hypothetical protein